MLCSGDVRSQFGLFSLEYNSIFDFSLVNFFTIGFFYDLASSSFSAQFSRTLKFLQKIPI